MTVSGRCTPRSTLPFAGTFSTHPRRPRCLDPASTVRFRPLPDDSTIRYDLCAPTTTAMTTTRTEGGRRRPRRPLDGPWSAVGARWLSGVGWCEGEAESPKPPGWRATGRADGRRSRTRPWSSWRSRARTSSGASVSAGIPCRTCSTGASSDREPVALAPGAACWQPHPSPGGARTASGPARPAPSTSSIGRQRDAAFAPGESACDRKR